MNFSSAEPDEDLNIMRFTSENGVWELGIREVLYGYRINLNWMKPVPSYGEPHYHVLDYCGGADEAFVLQLLATVHLILSGIPETVTAQDIKRTFPGWKVRPIHKDPCWVKLQEMAGTVQKSSSPHHSSSSSSYSSS